MMSISRLLASLFTTAPPPANDLFGPGFGNILLRGLEEIELPDLPSYRPQTVGWWILLGLGLGAIAIYSIRTYRHWRANRYRRVALQKLTMIMETVQSSPTPELTTQALTDLAILIKHTALQTFPRTEVAALSGAEWLTFLDQSYGGTDFSQGPGQILAHLAYQPPSSLSRSPEAIMHDLVPLVAHWIKRHRPLTPH